MTRDQFIAYMKTLTGHEHFGSHRRLAQHCDVGESYLSEIFRGTRDPGPKVLRSLGFKKIIAYEPIEAGGGGETKEEAQG